MRRSDEDPNETPRTRDDLPLPAWVPAAGAGVVLLLAIYVGLKFGPGPAILVLAGAMLIAVVWLVFRAIQSVAEPADEEALVAAPTPAEVQKQSALRALKDLEYERSIGNIGEADFAQLVDRSRDDAKRAMRLVDEERAELRAAAEVIAKRAIAKLDEEPKPAVKEVASYREQEESPKKAVRSGDEEDDAVLAGLEPAKCPACDTKNDRDARFCKKCGAPIAAPSDQ